MTKSEILNKFKESRISSYSLPTGDFIRISNSKVSKTFTSKLGEDNYRIFGKK